jgi:acyl phosphate:glycerol-3-phosphate acyltransferase
MAVGIVLLSFLVGSVPSSYLAARWVRDVDLRRVGSGTVSGTSLFRVAGFWPLAAAGLVDLGKGALGPLLAGDRLVVAALAGGAAVAGHNWSVFLRGAGGRGLAPALGALLVEAWPGAVVLLAGMLLGKLFRATGLGALVAELALTPALAVWGGAAGALAGAAIATPLLLKRVLGNGPPVATAGVSRPRVWLHRLLFDRDPEPRRP